MSPPFRNDELPSSNVLELAENAYSEMLAAGVILNKINVSNFSRCLCSVGKFEKACNIIHEMMHNGFIPDTSTYFKTILIDSFCKADLIEQAHNWFDEMAKGGCAPNVVTYTAIVHAYLKARNVSKADELFEIMLSKGCTPNVLTYTTLIDGHCN
ncbi:hypothetical protein GOBAR_DD11195 [Gossypium barbadense]|nr:hypothetical protein GOBAR_DD11195 [Gossypium barbadense]